MKEEGINPEKLIEPEPEESPGDPQQELNQLEQSFRDESGSMLGPMENVLRDYGIEGYHMTSVAFTTAGKGPPVDSGQWRLYAVKTAGGGYRCGSFLFSENVQGYLDGKANLESKEQVSHVFRDNGAAILEEMTKVLQKNRDFSAYEVIQITFEPVQAGSIFGCTWLDGVFECTWL
jgi:hypothetical protein